MSCAPQGRRACRHDPAVADGATRAAGRPAPVGTWILLLAWAWGAALAFQGTAAFPEPRPLVPTAERQLRLEALPARPSSYRMRDLSGAPVLHSATAQRDNSLAKSDPKLGLPPEIHDLPNILVPPPVPTWRAPNVGAFSPFEAYLARAPPLI